MADARNRQCAHKGCSKRPSYGTDGSRKNRCCSEHKRAGMVDVMNKRCAFHGCSKQPSYGADCSRKAEFCREHKGAGMVDVISKRCAYHGCSKQPSYGTEGSRKAEFCGEHKRAGMVDVMNTRCAFHGCSKQPSYGADGSRKAEFCGEHKVAGMVDVISKQCAHHGCSKQPSYGTEGSKQPQLCSEHKGAGMVNVAKKRCAYLGCSKQPSYAMEGSKKPELCREHKRAGMVNVISKRCAYHGCSKQPSYGIKGSRKTEFCSEHQRPGMVDVRSKLCAYHGCPKRPSYGRVGSRKTKFCSEHNGAGMVDGSTTRCASEGCVKFAVYGPDSSRRQGLLCSRHFTEGRQAGPSAVEAGKAREKATETDEDSGGQLSLPNTLKRALRADRFPRQVTKTPGSVDCCPSRGKRMRVFEREKGGVSLEAQQVSAFVTESSPTASPHEFTPLASQGRSDQSRATQNVGRDDRATSRARRHSMRFGCGKDGVCDLPPDSCVATANPAELTPTQGVVRTNTGEREFTDSTGTTRSGNSLLGCGGGGEQVEAGDGRAMIKPHCAGAERDVSTTFSQSRRHTRASCTFVREDRCKSASLEQEKREAFVELEVQVAFDAKIYSKVEANSKSLGHRMKSVIGGPGTADQAQTTESVNGKSPGPVDMLVEEGEMDGKLALCELKNEGAAKGGVSPLRGLDVTTVAIKLEGSEARALVTSFESFGWQR